MEDVFQGDSSSLRVMSYNVQNYFNGRYKNGQTGFQGGRGPANEGEYLRKKRHLVSLIKRVDPDIVALQEVENDTRFPRPAIKALIKALGSEYEMAKLSKGSRQFFGTDAITQFILYRPSATLQSLDQQVSIPWSSYGDGRPLILQKFRVGKSQAQEFCLANSHLKSRRNSCGADAQCTKKRVKQATAFNRALQKKLKYCDRILWVGDFNAKPRDKTLKYLRAESWQPLIKKSDYSYTYRGNKVLLDHALTLGNFPQGTQAQSFKAVKGPSDHLPIVIDIPIR